MDLRQKSQWGIGAEILLRAKINTEQPPLDDEALQNEDNLNEQWFTAEAFEKAKAYFLRLILQYSKTSARNQEKVNLGNAGTFNLVMIRLWVVHVQLQRKRAESRMNDEAVSGAQEAESIKREGIVKDQLAGAKEISRYLEDDVLKSDGPRKQELQELQVMVEKWVVDLEVERSLFTPDIDARRWRFEQSITHLRANEQVETDDEIPVTNDLLD